MSEFSKQNKTKEVTFKKDFGKFYKKGETHFIHEDSVKKLGLEKVADVKDVDWKARYKEAAKNAVAQEPNK